MKNNFFIAIVEKLEAYLYKRDRNAIESYIEDNYDDFLHISGLLEDYDPEDPAIVYSGKLFSDLVCYHKRGKIDFFGEGLDNETCDKIIRYIDFVIKPLLKELGEVMNHEQANKEET